MPLLNWSPDKGNPADYDGFATVKQKINKEKINFEFKILDEKYPKYKKSLLEVFVHTQIMSILTLTKLQAETFIKGANKKIGLIDYFYYLNNKELEKAGVNWKIHFDYPFNCCVEVECSLDDYDNVGSLSYFISKVYYELYKKHYKKIGVYGHGLSDLTLSSIIFRSGNIIELGISS